MRLLTDFCKYCTITLVQSGVTIMFLNIDFGGSLPIYDQVVRQVKFAVAGGAIKEGELIPSVRELARELTINPNTVARAYRQLQDDGVLVTVRGTGLAVASGAGNRCQQERVELIRSRLEQVIAEAKQSRIEPEKLRELVERQLGGGASDCGDSSPRSAGGSQSLAKREIEGKR
jgi:GntR family transcriptional regulator